MKNTEIHRRQQDTDDEHDAGEVSIGLYDVSRAGFEGRKAIVSNPFFYYSWAQIGTKE